MKLVNSHLIVLILTAGVTFGITNYWFNIHSNPNQPQNNPTNPLSSNSSENLAKSTSEPVAQTELDPNPIMPPSMTATQPRVKSVQPELATDATIQSEPTIKPSCVGTLANQFLCLLNEYRTTKGLGKLSLNNSLSNVSTQHSSWMNQTNTFSHTGLNDSNFAERCQLANITCLAENLAEGIMDPDRLLKAWQANSGHNKNLLGPYTNLGFGVSGTYITILFN